MPAYDYRTKPHSEWSYYVVDNLVTMANIYRYDTVQEAIEKYKSIPGKPVSAIGSSKDGKYEIDHIHRLGSESVLIRDMDNMTNSLWRDSKEISEAVALMRSELRVRFEKSGMFGAGRGNVSIPITDAEHATYSTVKQLDPRNSDHPLSSINEVHVTGKGWVDIVSFLKSLENRKWSPKTGYPVPFVNHLNVRYKESRGYIGQMDVTPAQFLLMRDALIKAQERKPGLDEKIGNAEAKTPRPVDRDNNSPDKTR